jgi:cation:H+ antiporter
MALINPMELPMPREAIAVDIPVMIMVVIACLPIFISGYKVSRIEGALFLIYYLAYILILYYRGSTESVLSGYTNEFAILALPIFIITTIVVITRQLRNKRLSKGDSQ